MKAFTPSGTFYDSAQADGQEVEHTTSWLTINPMKGCSLGCAYCFRARWHPAKRPTAQYSVDDAVAKLVGHRDFVPHDTPVSVNVSSTDALLPTVRPTTLRALELLERAELRNPVGITTKLRLRDSDLAFLQRLRYVRPIVFVSLALLPRHIEPLPIRPRVENLERLSAANIPCVLYFRPIVEGWNDSPEIIAELLRLADAHCDAVCIGGLRMSAEIEQELRAAGATPPSSASSGFHTKAIPAQARRSISVIHDEFDLTVPVYTHTSCAVSKVMERRNYNALYTDPEAHCSSTCPADQQDRCVRGSG